MMQTIASKEEPKAVQKIEKTKTEIEQKVIDDIDEVPYYSTKREVAYIANQSIATADPEEERTIRIDNSRNAIAKEFGVYQ